MKPQLQVLGTDIKFIKFNDDDFISLTDIARYKNPGEPKDVIKNWLRTKNTIEFLGLWEIINNPEFKGVEFDSLIKTRRTKNSGLECKKIFNKSKL